MRDRIAGASGPVRLTKAACRIRHNQCNLCFASPAVDPRIPPASPFSPVRYRACSDIPNVLWKEIMRIYSSTRFTGAVLTTLLFALSAFARDHSALNGTWTLVPAKSDFAGQPVVQTGTVTINDHQGIIDRKSVV